MKHVRNRKYGCGNTNRIEFMYCRGVPCGTRLSTMKATVPASLLLETGAATAPMPYEPVTRSPGTSCLAHPKKYETKSEDAHFIISMNWPSFGPSPVTYFGVADGVGSWRQYEVDPSLFSSTLMNAAKDTVAKSAEVMAKVCSAKLCLCSSSLLSDVTVS